MLLMMNNHMNGSTISNENHLNVQYQCCDQFCFTSQGKDSDMILTLWNIETGEQIFCSEPELKDDIKITCANIWWSSVAKINKRARRAATTQSEDANSVVALGTQQGSIILYSLAKDEQIGELSQNRLQQKITSITFLNASLFVSYDDGTIVEWNLINKCVKNRYNTTLNNISRMEALDDGTILLASDDDFSIRQFDLKKKHSFKSFIGHKSPVNYLQPLIVNDSRFFLSSALDDNHITVWDLSKISKPNALARFLLNEPPTSFHVTSLCEFNWCLLVVARNGELNVFQDSYNLIGRNSGLTQNGRRVVPTVEIVPTFQIQLQISNLRANLLYSCVTSITEDNVKHSRVLLIYEKSKSDSDPLFSTLTIGDIENAHLNTDNIIHFSKSGNLIKRTKVKKQSNFTNNNILNNNNSNNNHDDHGHVTDKHMEATNGQITTDSSESYGTPEEDIVEQNINSKNHINNVNNITSEDESSDDAPIISQNVQHFKSIPTKDDIDSVVSNKIEISQEYSSTQIFNILTPGYAELSFENFSRVINNVKSDVFIASIKKMPNTNILYVFNLLQDSLLNKFSGKLDRQKCVQLMASLIKLKFDYLQNVPSLKKELSIMNKLIEQRSRILIDSNRILGRLQLILRKNSSLSNNDFALKKIKTWCNRDDISEGNDNQDSSFEDDNLDVQSDSDVEDDMMDDNIDDDDDDNSNLQSDSDMDDEEDDDDNEEMDVDG